MLQRRKSHVLDGQIERCHQGTERGYQEHSRAPSGPAEFEPGLGERTKSCCRTYRTGSHPMMQLFKL